jgi:DNA-directed RNA polymerase specialized sigma24 family protein
LLWRYMRLAVEAGRLPSLLGREFFRARVSPYSAQTFEDTVIFVHDVECCLNLLDAADKILIATLGMEQYTQEEAAESLRCTQRTIGRRYAEALDNLSQIFLKREILMALPEKNTNVPEACQEGKTDEFLVSDSE